MPVSRGLHRQCSLLPRNTISLGLATSARDCIGGRPILPDEGYY